MTAPHAPRFAAPLALALAACAGLPAHESTLHRFFLAQAAVGAAAASAGPTVPLTIDVRVAGEAEPGAALVRLTDAATGKTANLPAHLRRQAGWYSVAAGATVAVPPGEWRVEACRGLDTEIARATIRVEAGRPARVALALTRFYDAAARGLVGANTHLHLRLGSSGGTTTRTLAHAEEYLRTVGHSDLLDLAFVSHLVRPGDHYISNDFTAADLARMSDARLRFVNGEEHRHEGGRVADKGGPGELRYGHVLFLNLPRLVEPVSYGAIFDRDRPATDARPLRRGIEEARSLGATIVWCHGRQGLEDVPNWIDGLLHAQNIFDGGSEGGLDRVYYTYLNAGLRVPFSTGTDWGVYDFNRAYVPLTARPVTGEAYLRQLAAGRAFITNGTLLEFEVDGLGAGDTLELAAARAVRIRGRGLGRDDFLRLEIVFNGAVVAQAACRAEGGHFDATLDTTFEVREPGWLALRIPMEKPYTDRAQFEGPGANLFGKALFAHTSPVYVTLAGRGVRQPAALRQLIAELDTAVAAIDAKGAFADAAERDGVLGLYRAAKARLEGQLAAAP